MDRLAADNTLSARRHHVIRMACHELGRQSLLLLPCHRRKLVNWVRLHAPVVPSQLSECGGAGTGCGWCIPFLKQIFRQGTETGGSEPPSAEGAALESLSPEEYARLRARIREGGEGDAARRGAAASGWALLTDFFPVEEHDVVAETPVISGNEVRRRRAMESDRVAARGDLNQVRFANSLPRRLAPRPDRPRCERN